MAAVIHFSRRNIEEQTGGPFAAGVFERETGKPIIIGVNRVMDSGLSCAHAEFMTISAAQLILGSFDLGGPGMADHQFVVNWRPCVMCMGSTLWSGARSLVIAGEGPELEDITGFDEGPVHPNWRAELEARGIQVTSDVLRDDAIAVFEQFRDTRQHVYNPRQG